MSPPLPGSVSRWAACAIWGEDAAAPPATVPPARSAGGGPTAGFGVVVGVAAAAGSLTRHLLLTTTRTLNRAAARADNAGDGVVEPPRRKELRSICRPDGAIIGPESGCRAK